jgi:hypothetical protein
VQQIVDKLNEHFRYRIEREGEIKQRENVLLHFMALAEERAAFSLCCASTREGNESQRFHCGATRGELSGDTCGQS